MDKISLRDADTGAVVELTFGALLCVVFTKFRSSTRGAEYDRYDISVSRVAQPILDVALTGADYEELQSWLRKRGASMSVPIVHLSNEVDLNPVPEFIEVPAHAEPVDPNRAINESLSKWIVSMGLPTPTPMQLAAFRHIVEAIALDSFKRLRK